MRTENIFSDEKAFGYTAITIGSLLSSKQPHYMFNHFETLYEDLPELFAGDYYFLIFFDILNVSRPFRGADGSAGNMTLRRIASELNSRLSPQFQLLPCFTSDTLCLLALTDRSRFPQDFGGSDIQFSLYTDCIRAHEYMLDTFGIDLQLFIGEPVDNIDFLYKEHQRMSTADIDEFSLSDQYPPVQILSESNRLFFNPTKEEAQKISDIEFSICKAAVVGDFQTVDRLFMQIIDLELSVFPQKKNLIRKAMDRMSIIFALSKTPPYTEDVPELNYQTWHINLHNTTCVDELKNTIHLILKACGDTADPPAVIAQKDISAIVTFIKKNFADPSLCSTAICEKFNLNLSTFSRQFKEYSGFKFIDYLHRCRIDNAKKMLTDMQDVKMDDIARMSGYSSTLTFFRAFKRMEGMTPGVYKLEQLQSPSTGD